MLTSHASKGRETYEDASSLKYVSADTVGLYSVAVLLMSLFMSQILIRCNMIVDVIYLGFNPNYIFNFALFHTALAACISQPGFLIYKVKGQCHCGPQSFIMFLVSQDHDQKPKRAHKILAKLSQTEMFKREQKVGQPVQSPVSTCSSLEQNVPEPKS